MFTKYKTIRDFDNYLLNQQNFSQNFSIIDKKQDVLKQTQDNCPETDRPLIKTRSLKARTLSIQTSFRDKFLEKHIQSFKKNFMLFIQKSYPQLKNCSFKNQIYQIFGNNLQSCLENEKLKDLLEKDKKYFQYNEKILFQLDLFYEESLNEFLSSICAQIPSHIGIELFYVAYIFWKAYVQNQRTQLSEQEIKVLVQNVLESEELQNFICNALFLNFRNAQHASFLDDGKTVVNLKSFLKIYGFTILMVIQQYFSNPFCKGQGRVSKIRNVLQFRDISNDEFSDEEGDVKLHVCNKKRKF